MQPLILVALDPLRETAEALDSPPNELRTHSTSNGHSLSFNLGVMIQKIVDDHRRKSEDE